MNTDPNHCAFPSGELDSLGVTKLEFFAAVCLAGILANEHCHACKPDVEAAIKAANLLVKGLNEQ